MSETERRMVNPESSRLDHPSLDRLVAYHEQRLTAAEAEELRDHLAACSRCTEQILDLAVFNTPLQEPVDLAARREARLLARAIASEERARRWKAVLAIAAGVVLTTLGVLVYRELGAPPRTGRGGELVLASLYPKSEMRSHSTDNEVILPEEAPYLGLILNLVQLPSCRAYRYVLRDQAGVMVHEAAGLQPTENGLFQVLVPAGKLKSGLFAVELYGDAGCERKIETFPLQISRTPPRDGT